MTQQNDEPHATDRRSFLKLTGSAAGALFLSNCASVSTAQTISEITDLSASQLSAAIRERRVSCIEVMQAYLARIHRYNPDYNAIVSLLEDEILLQQALAADQALDRGEYWGWMHGMPHAVKDLADAEGLESSYGSPIFAGIIAKKDSLPISRIRAQGAIFIGKTNTPEFGLGSQSYNPVHGTTANAYNVNLTAGGSSGGAGSALGLQIVPCADGSDLMGSLRNPAAFNNVIGFRPSQGRIPSPSPQNEVFYDQLATDGPMGRTVEDTIRLFQTMAGHDPLAPMSIREPIPNPNKFKANDLSQIKIGWMGNYDGYLPMETGVLDVCEAALNMISDRGAQIERCHPKFDMALLWETWLTFRHWFMSGFRSMYEDPDTRPLLKPELIWEIEGGIDMSAARVSAGAVNRSNWFRALNQLFENYDILALPTAQVFPFSKEIHWPSSINNTQMDTYHRWMEVVVGGTLSGMPVISLPAGFDENGRPMGLQFIAPYREDKKLLEFALAYEQVTPYLAKRPRL